VSGWGVLEALEGTPRAARRLRTCGDCAVADGGAPWRAVETLAECTPVGAWYAALFVSAASLVVLITPAVRAVALRLGAVDQGGGRRVHDGRVPRLGGVALLVAGAGALAIADALGLPLAAILAEHGWHLESLGLGALLVLLLGVADDLYGVTPRTKLVWQIGAACIVLVGGYEIAAITNPLSGGVVSLAPFGGMLTVLWIVSITNAFNLIDGLDGLAAGTALIASITLFLVALSEGRPDAAIMACALGGALAGFLRFNFAPASIFLGDAGSLLLGFLLSVFSIQSLQKGPTAVVVLVPVLMLGLPILEAAVTIVRRAVVNGIASVFQADQEHIHHRLLDLGMTHRRAVLVLYVVCAAFGLLAFVAVSVRGLGNAAIVAAVALAAYLGMRALGYRGR
jgi:UDP-GlcNAc:undecaprenyl-phosphate GlcNAc-1-phosphate transferase